jgi:hypothetical protein
MDQWGWEQLDPWQPLWLELPVGALFCVIDGRTRGRPLTAGSSAGQQLQRTAAHAG